MKYIVLVINSFIEMGKTEQDGDVERIAMEFCDKMLKAKKYNECGVLVDDDDKPFIFDKEPDRNTLISILMNWYRTLTDAILERFIYEMTHEPIDLDVDLYSSQSD